MKRHGNLWPQVIDFGNLLDATQQAQRGKRYRANVLRFNDRLAEELLQLQAALDSRTYRPGPYRTFEIVVPKQRLISAAPYRDRVVHHALCQVIAPIFERTMIRDSYANRTGFGTHRALRRFTEFARSSRYVLQCDIRQYFPSIDHEILKTLLRRKIKCAATLWLIDTIIDASNAQPAVHDYFPGDALWTPYERRRGLPIGNLTSQFFANVYLSGLDHFVKQNLGIGKYVRYVDDFALFGDDHAQLAAARWALEDYLAQLRLCIHPVKSQLFETRHGANFVGFRVLADHLTIRNENLRRARRRLRGLQTAFQAGQLSLAELTQRIGSWIAHLAHADTWRMRERVFSELAFTSC
ncbi:MAG: RNA-dependent DNA polymerase [Acidobacteria bacterium]|nr:RNA-dependent DNA polymerase [Acidobacteriota bacterium]MBI3426539.1 RNA-dependent DNA polymerase [Acidobacteriota bacterium]